MDSTIIIVVIETETVATHQQQVPSVSLSTSRMGKQNSKLKHDILDRLTAETYCEYIFCLKNCIWSGVDSVGEIDAIRPKEGLA